MNVYRITVRGEDGRVKAREKKAANLRLAVEGQDELAKIVKVERIHPKTGEVLGGIYHHHEVLSSAGGLYLLRSDLTH